MKIAAYSVLGLAILALAAAFACWMASVWGLDDRWAQTAGIMVALSTTSVFAFVFLQIGRS